MSSPSPIYSSRIFGVRLTTLNRKYNDKLLAVFLALTLLVLELLLHRPEVELALVLEDLFAEKGLVLDMVLLGIP